jgi:hypothetical protein
VRAAVLWYPAAATQDTSVVQAEEPYPTAAALASKLRADFLTGRFRTALVPPPSPLSDPTSLAGDSMPTMHAHKDRARERQCIRIIFVGYHHA